MLETRLSYVYLDPMDKCKFIALDATAMTHLRIVLSTPDVDSSQRSSGARR